MPVLDGVASIVIGLLLAGVRRAEVEGVGSLLSMYIGRAEVPLTLDVHFKSETPADAVARSIDAIEHEVRTRFPVIRRIYTEPVSVSRALHSPS